MTLKGAKHSQSLLFQREVGKKAQEKCRKIENNEVYQLPYA